MELLALSADQRFWGSICAQQALPPMIEASTGLGVPPRIVRLLLSAWLLLVIASALLLASISSGGAYPLGTMGSFVSTMPLEDIFAVGGLTLCALLSWRLLQPSTAVRVLRVSNQTGKGPADRAEAGPGLGQRGLSDLLNLRRHLQWRRLYLCWFLEFFQRIGQRLCQTMLDAGESAAASSSYGLWDFHEASRTAGFLLPKEVAACRTEPDVSDHIVRLLQERRRYRRSGVLPPVAEE